MVAQLTQIWGVVHQRARQLAKENSTNVQRVSQQIFKHCLV